ncbi:hypothetical protein EUGRSUZ_I01447 [Eucalyptus grandis]|uniref:Uncharacterized protein n=2 Tax=Eucalyptus grandis TaxID=71139 RepID=A0ACC3JHW3_EUCGR|nr:hypothetical protein EUGRSUZ_I01447 [Eucalyptus grandis]
MTMVSPPKWLVLMISIISSISDGHARARIPISSKVTGFDKPKGTIKTIESYETGEVIDCVDIFKQPAFDHPLLKNHTIQIKPSSNPKANGEVDVEGALGQAWWKNGECPEGTIPILRPQNHTDHHFMRSKPHVKRLNSNDAIIIPPRGHEYAEVSLIDGVYKGASAKINVWKPLAVNDEASISQIWVTSGALDSLNSVEAGWMVNTVYGTGLDAQIFIYWTTDGYKKTGCFNLKCPGFVQTNKRIALGAVISPVSTYKGQQYEIAVNITKEVGYWPKELFTLLKGFATQISWGGEVYNSRKYGIHTGTQMGSGSFPSEGYGKAAFFRNLKMIAYESIERDPENLQPYVTRPECYDLKLVEDRSSSNGVHFFFGGPGYSPQCIN